MNIKVMKGTRPSGKRLCDTCQSSVITRGEESGSEAVYCRETESKVWLNVVECNRHEEDGRPSLYHLEKIAWVLDIDRKRQRIGFMNAAEWWAKTGDDAISEDLLD